MKSSRFVPLLLLALFSCGNPMQEEPGQEQSGTTEPGSGDSVPTGKSLLDFAAYKSGDNWGPALQQAIKECQRIRIPAGTYRMSAVQLASDTEITGVAIGADIPDFGNELTLSREGPTAGNQNWK